MKRIVISMLVFMFFANRATVSVADVPLPLAASTLGWIHEPAYSDEFDGQALDQNKWNNKIGSWKNWTWRPENVAVADGHLAISMAYEPHQRDGQDIFYTSGIVMHRQPILYGYFEARIKGASLYPGVCPAFWAWHKEKDKWTEIDFVEMTEHPLGPRILETNTHLFRHPALPNGKPLHESRIYRADWDPRDDFHVYGSEWDDKQIRWYVDGKLVASRVNDYWHQPLDLTLSLGLRPPLSTTPSSVGLPTTFLVDYIRVWKKSPVPNKHNEN